MFQMFVLLVNEINPHSFCFVTSFLFIFMREALPHRGCSTLSPVLDICEFAMGICRRNLPWLFAVRICRGFFVCATEFFFAYVSKSYLYGRKLFVYVNKTF